MRDAFGVEHGEVSKGLPSALRAARPGKLSGYAKSRVSAHNEGRLARFGQPGNPNQKYLIRRGKKIREQSRDDMYPHVTRTWNTLKKPADRFFTSDSYLP